MKFFQRSLLKRLLVMIGMCIAVTSMYASNYYAEAIAVETSGLGKVYITYDRTTYDQDATGRATTGSQDQSSQSFSLKLGVKEVHKDYFVKQWYDDAGTYWTNTDNSNETNATIKSEATSSESRVIRTFYPIYTRQIETPQEVTINEVGVEFPVKFKLNKGTSVTATSSNPTKFVCSAAQYVGPDANDWQFTITATDQALVNDNATITLKNESNAEATLVVTLRVNQTVTFMGSTLGTYVVSQGSAFSHRIEAETNLPPLVITDPDNFVLSFTEIQPIDGYRFNRFKCTPEEGSPYYIYDDEQDGTAQSGKIQVTTTIEPEFVPVNYAQFIVLGTDTTIHYSHLDRAVEVAQANYKNVVAVYKKGGLLEVGHYNIPSGITLLIPGKMSADKKSVDYTYVAATAAPTSNDFGSTATPTHVSTLTVQSNTTIDVKGSICVYGMGGVCTSSQNSMKHISYGLLELQDNSVINLNDGSTLHALGYITNVDGTTIVEDNLTNVDSQQTVGKVISHAGSTVYEVFKINDWRGGNIVAGFGDLNMETINNALTLMRGGQSGMINNPERVFIMNQYFIQNVEAPLVLKHGSTLKVVLIVGLASFKPMAIVDFVVPNRTTSIESGLFRLGDDSQLIKYYDPSTDRLKFIVERMGVSEETLKTQLHTIKMNLKVDVSSIPIVGNMVPNGVVDIPVSTNQYVMPITNNMDIVLRNGADVEVVSTSDMAFLVGSTLTIKEKSKLDIQSNVFVYDKDEIRFHDTGNSSVDGFGYVHIGNYVTVPLNYRPYAKTVGGVNDYGMKFKRTEANTKDAKWIINGDLTINGALYTTQGGADITSDITAQGIGRVKFNNIGKDNEETRQAYVPTGNVAATYYQIPITKGKLHNNETLNPYEPYSALDAQPGDEYVYHAQEGKWLQPTLSIPGGDNTVFRLTLPNDVTQIVKGHVIAEGVTIKSWNIRVIDGSGNFEIDKSALDNQEYEYVNDESALYIPIKYIARNIHNIDENNPYTGTIEITINYDDLLTGPNQTLTQTIALKAFENYVPDFVVVIDGDTIKDVADYSMSGFIQRETFKNDIIIKPTQDKVATLVRTKWQKQVSAPFDFTYGTFNSNEFLASLKYFPQDLNNPHEATLILTASYTDDNPDPVKAVHTKSITINLTANAALQPNTLAFRADLQDGATIYQGQSLDNIIADFGNLEDIAFKFDDKLSYEADLVTIEGNIDDNYKLITKEIDDITDIRNIIIKAVQQETAFMRADSVSFQLSVLPSIIWNWSNLYFGEDYSEPFGSEIEGAYTLTLTSLRDLDGTNVSPNSVMNYDETNRTVSVLPNLTGEYIATFVFTQSNGYTKTFTSNIYLDPRKVTYCVEDARVFNRVTLPEFTTDVTFDDGNVRFASTQTATSTWTIAVAGVPDSLKFTPIQTDKAWHIEAYNGMRWETIYAWDTLTVDVQKRISLLPNTQQIRFTYAAGDGEVGVLSNVCVTDLKDIKAHTDKLYIPIAKNENSDVVPTTQKLTFYYVNDTDLSISFSNNQLTSDVTTLSANLGDYVEQTVIITNNGASEDVVNLYVKDNLGKTHLTLPIRPFEYRQGLSINSATDPTERYYFLTTASATETWADSTTTNVRWDETHRAIVFQNPNSIAARRCLTIAYEGAADYIQFHTSANTILSEWVFAESADGLVWTSPTVDTLKTIVNDGKGIRRELNYTTRYVRISYRTSNIAKLLVTNLLLEGTPHLIVNPTSMTLNDDVDNNGHIGLLTLTAINLKQIRVVSNSPTNFKIIHNADNLLDQVSEFVATSTAYPNALGTNKVGTIQLGVAWQMINTIDDATITIYNDENDEILAVVDVLGAKGLLTQGNAKTGLYTGIPDGTRDINGDGVINTDDKFTYHGQDYKDYKYHEVDVTNAFTTDGKALFDYLFIFGETRATNGNNITPPEGKTLVGSNATTPYYVYKKTTNQAGDYVAYQFVGTAETNTKEKAKITGVVVSDSVGVVYIDVEEALRVYITGFCPYATTGYDKLQEGVFLFRGEHGEKLDVYLEDCHIASRNKTENGNTFFDGKEGGEVFTDGYARGSGGVLVFENVDPQEQLQNFTPFEISIHTIGDNMLSSSYGCFFGLNLLGEIGMKATQVSSPIHIHMHKKDYARKTKTTINFDDKWPTTLDGSNAILNTIRTNGFLALKKQANNAPSIDMGNAHTTVNFRGGRVELQNSLIGSDTYKTTLAISHRSGYFGSGDAGVQLCYGIGTDSVGGTVNFFDGTVTVRPMKVPAAYQQYYLMDPEIGSNGDTIKVNGEIQRTDYTSCLRLPMNTYVYGGSHSFMRACQHVTSKGGAPKDGPNGSYLGQYVYKLQDDDKVNARGLATEIQFPNNIKNPSLTDYLTARSREYYLESVAPDAQDQLYFWIPDGYGNVTAEQDKNLFTWKACMTEIGAGITGVKEGRIGGDTPVEVDEEIKYFLYCQIDQNIRDVIRAGEKDPVTGEVLDYTYQPPFEVPSAAKLMFNNETYARYDLLTYVSDSLQYQVTSDTAYTITNRAYYITTATADIWQTFAAPFDVENIYVLEAYSESALKQEGNGNRTDILRAQAAHNADFAAFFAVEMAMGTDKDFDEIYQSYKKWAYTEDKKSDLYKGNEADYNLRSMQELVPYIGKNWRDANFYLNHNAGNWVLTDEESYEVQWEMLTASDTTDGILLHKGETYSLMFPYCPSCEESLDNRTYWDYWSGKFLIFESTAGAQVINGRDFLNDTVDGNVFMRNPDPNKVIVTGNSTLSFLDTSKDNVYRFNSKAPALNRETFELNVEYDDEDNPIPVSTPTRINPTTAFLYGNVPTKNGMPARGIKRTGEIIYDKENTPTGNQGGNIPTIGGGNDLFITSTVEGINIAVAEPQHVRVLSSTGAVLYSGIVQTAVDVALPTTGVYVITGENEVHKILH